MKKPTKQYKQECNEHFKLHYPSLRVVNKKLYYLGLVFLILGLAILVLSIPVIVMANNNIDLNKGGLVIKIQHEFTSESLEVISKYVDYFINRENG